MKRRPTISDVAKKASLSISTVSLVINNRAKVSEETRRKVKRVIDELGYHPHHSARGLASRLSGNLGFIVSEDHFSQAEPFYTRIFLGTEFEARVSNYYILLTTVGKKFDGAGSVPRFLLERNVDGIVIAGKVDKKLIDCVVGAGLPIVLVDFMAKPKRVSSILIDNHSGARMAVRHLAQHGHRRIAFIGGDLAHPSIGERREGYRDALAESNIHFQENLVVDDEPDTGVEQGLHAAEKLFTVPGNRPTAIFAANDAMAIGAMQYIKRIRLRIPEDVAIIGFDDIESGSLMEPRLSTIRVFKEEMGKLAVRHLVNVIKSGMAATVTMHVPVELVVRESSAKPLVPSVPGEFPEPTGAAVAG